MGNSNRIQAGNGVMLLLLLLLVPAASAKPVLQVRRVDQAPRLDGRLNDPAWSRGPWRSDFHLVRVKAPARMPGPTRFKFAIGDQRLYFAARCEAKQDLPKPSHYDRRDDKEIWERQSIELFLGASGSPRQYAHLMFGADGATYDSRRSQHGRVNEATWSARTEHRVIISGNTWTLEAAIPLADLGLGESSRNPWPINVARNGGSHSHASYAPVEESFHEPSKFPRVDLPVELLRPYFWTTTVQEPPHMMLIDGRRRIKTTIAYQNQTGGDRRVAVSAQWTDAKAEPDPDPDPSHADRRTLEVPAGGKRTLTFLLPMPEVQAESVIYELSVLADGSRQLVRRDRRELSDERSLFQLRMARPFYRNTIYASQSIKVLRLRPLLNMSASRVKNTPLTLTLTGPEGRKVKSEKTRLRRAGQTLELEIGDLSPGRYTLTGEATLDGGRTLTASEPLHVVPTARDEWYVDSNLVLRHNGKRVMPLGYFNGVSHADALTREGANVFVEYNAPVVGLKKVMAWLDRAAKHDSWLLIQPYAGMGSSHPEKKDQPLSETFVNNLRQRIRAIKDHPGLMGYYLSDEPAVDPIMQKRLARIYEICREEDPYHPAILLDYKMEGVREYVDQCDVFMPDFYPGFDQNGRSNGDMNKVARSTRAVLREGDHRVPAWPVPQVFSWGVWGRPGKRAPRFMELRNMFYQAITAGGKGMIAYTFKNRGAHPHLEIGMQHLYREIRELQPFVLAPDAGLVDPVDSDQFFVSSRRDGDRIAVFATYTGTTPRRFTLPLAGPARRVKTWHVKNEGRTVSGGAAIRDRFGTDAAHVYLSQPSRSPGPSLDRVRKRIAHEINSRRDPANLIQSTKGVEIAASSNVSWGGAPGIILKDGWWGRRPRTWIPESSDDRQSVTFTFPDPVRGEWLVIHGSHLSVPAVQVSPTGESWKTIDAKPIRRNLKRLELRLDAERFSKLRIRFADASDRPHLLEVRLYRNRPRLRPR